MSRVSQFKSRKSGRSGWAVPEGMRLVQVQLPKDMYLRLKLEAVRREKPFSGFLSAYLVHAFEQIDCETLVIHEPQAEPIAQ